MASPTITPPHDHLCLAGNPAVQKLLQKRGQNSPLPETVIFSDFVVKINRKEKQQTRVILLTDKAVYNLLPSASSECKRRIAIESIASITASSLSDEFVLHVPEEYDYRYMSSKKDMICDLVVKLFRKLWEKEEKVAQSAAGPSSKNKKHIHCTYLNETDLKEHAITKEMARLQTHDDILRRKQIAQSQDNEKQANQKSAKDGTTTSTPVVEIENLFETDEKVNLDDFDLLKVGMGFCRIMEVRKKSDGKTYAMKILRHRQGEHTKAQRTIVPHPFVITLRYAFRSKDKYYFVYDNYQGGELYWHLKQSRRLSEEDAKIYVAGITLALGHLHSQQIIYRELKPETIQFDDLGHACLTDLDIHKYVESRDTFCGTPEYLAPEIVAGQNSVALLRPAAVDWWSLGILLYELTVGIPPFYSQNVNEMYNKILSGVLRFPPFLSENCKSLIVGLLHRDPTQRLGSTQDMMDICAHPFLASINWDDMMAKRIPGPDRSKGSIARESNAAAMFGDL